MPQYTPAQRALFTLQYGVPPPEPEDRPSEIFNAWRNRRNLGIPTPPQLPRTENISLPPPPAPRAYTPLASDEAERAQAVGPQPVVYPSGFGGTESPGSMSVSGGGTLNNRTERALSGLKMASMGPERFMPTTPELYRLASRDPGDVAPGSNEYWGDMLKMNLGEQEWNTQQARKPQEAIRGGLTALHPAIQGAAEAEAVRRAYPAQATGQAEVGAQRLIAQARRIAAELGVKEQEMRTDAQLGEAALRGRQAAESMAKPDPEVIAKWDEIIRAVRQRKFFSPMPDQPLPTR